MNNGNTILGKLVEEKKQEFITVRAKINKNTKEKIEYICKRVGVEHNVYLGMIIENSEIEKVFAQLKKEESNDSQTSED